MFATKILQRPFRPDGGKAFVTEISSVSDHDFVYLLENGKSIGRPDALHGDIRERGGGLFSVWAGQLYFSSSDGSDCNENQREYSLAILDQSAGDDLVKYVLDQSILHQSARDNLVKYVLDQSARDHLVKDDLVKYVEKDDEAVLRAFAGNMRHNNKFVKDFFVGFDSVLNSLLRNGLTLPRTALEIGSGRLPYVGLRFLLEGGEQFVANDIFPVQATFSLSFVDALADVCEAARPALAGGIDRVFDRTTDPCRVRGLEVRGATPFEQLVIDREVDLILSTSVLEHVTEPYVIARRLADFMAPGGLMVHSIDLRDHRNFNEPFAFYQLTESEYAPIATENRLRASEWIDLIQSVGFAVVERYDGALSPESLATGHTHANANGSYKYYKAGEMIPTSISEEERETFAEPFRHKDLVDLSIICTQIICRKM